MEEAPEQKLQRIQDQVRRGEYTVDPNAVAEAVLERLRLRSLARNQLTGGSASRWTHAAQNECSYPCSGSAPTPTPDSDTPLPGTASPIHVTRLPRPSLSIAASIVLRLAVGAQTQSS
jgi:hypothetical protein